jgi:hypothetical protein
VADEPDQARQKQRIRFVVLAVVLIFAAVAAYHLYAEAMAGAGRD